MGLELQAFNDMNIFYGVRRWEMLCGKNQPERRRQGMQRSRCRCNFKQSVWGKPHWGHPVCSEEPRCGWGEKHSGQQTGPSGSGAGLACLCGCRTERPRLKWHVSILFNPDGNLALGLLCGIGTTYPCGTQTYVLLGKVSFSLSCGSQKLRRPLGRP